MDDDLITSQVKIHADIALPTGLLSCWLYCYSIYYYTATITLEPMVLFNWFHVRTIMINAVATLFYDMCEGFLNGFPSFNRFIICIKSVKMYHALIILV